MEGAELVVFLVAAFAHMVSMIMHERRQILEEQFARNEEERYQERRRILRRIAALKITQMEEAVHRRRQRRMVILQHARRASPIVWAHKRSDAWWTAVVPTFTDEQWVENFRMSRETFRYLCLRVQPAMEKQDTTFRLCVPLQQRVAMALWKLGTNAEYRSVGHLFGVSRATACKSLKDFCSAVEEILCPEVIQFPNADTFQEMATYFENRWGLPQCVGAIDGSHIPIMAPQEYHTEYFNRKGWYSIVLQAVVDGKGLFWNVFTGLPGSLHDARVLRKSGLWNVLEGEGGLFPGRRQVVGGHDMGHYILGDAAYPLMSWLMKPFADNGRLTQDQNIYNIRTSRARVVVENAFGRLKGRWRCLLKRNDCSTDMVKSMVVTCCVLHNLCETHGEDFREEWAAPADLDQPHAPLPAGADGVDTGVATRAALLRHLND